MASRTFDSETYPYDLYTQLAIDNGNDCISINVGRDEHDRSVKSLKHLSREIEHYILPDVTRLDTATKLYVIGDWNFTFDTTEAMEAALDEASEPWTAIDRQEDLGGNGDDKLTCKKIRTVTSEDDEWKLGVSMICEVIKLTRNLKELTWISTLAFTGAVWDALPTSLTKLVLDLGKPICVDSSEFYRETYISQDAMKPLVNCTKLVELRLLGMRESFQSIIWETVYRNDNGAKKLDVLHLQMASAPIVRGDGWLGAEEVCGLGVGLSAGQDGESVYKGVDGKGILHHAYGTGEYLDYMCIRKARQTAGPDQARPVPLWCLRLDGFVIDHLPFQTELTSIALLSCGHKCVDAGLRPPKTTQPSNAWGHIVKTGITHCMITWPLWTGIFDDHGMLLDLNGDVIEVYDEDSEEEPRGRSRYRE